MSEQPENRRGRGGLVRGVTGVLLAAPLVTLALWAFSGRPMFSASERAVDVVVEDVLFGERTTEKRFVRGPIFGYYVGMDAVAGATAIVMVPLMVLWVIRRRRGTPSGGQSS